MMDHSLAGKIVLITGAANGIGLVTAQCLASAGARLMLSDIDEVSGWEAVSQFQKLGRGFDHLVYTPEALALVFFVLTRFSLALAAVVPTLVVVVAR